MIVIISYAFNGYYSNTTHVEILEKDLHLIPTKHLLKKGARNVKYN